MFISREFTAENNLDQQLHEYKSLELLRLSVRAEESGQKGVADLYFQAAVEDVGPERNPERGNMYASMACTIEKVVKSMRVEYAARAETIFNSIQNFKDKDLQRMDEEEEYNWSDPW